MQPSKNKGELSVFSQSLFAVVNRFDDTLWIPGLVLTVLTGVWLTVASVPARQGEIVRLLYALLGVVFPWVIFLRPSKRTGGSLQNWSVVVSIFLLIMLSLIGFLQLKSPCILLSAALELIFIFLLLRRGGKLHQVFIDKGLTGFVGVLAVIACWSIDTTVVWWEDWSDLFRHSAAVMLIFALSLLAAVYWVFQLPEVSEQRRLNPIADTVLTMGSIFVFAMASLRPYKPATPPFDMTFGIHHWGAYVGPAQMVRQGGYLLWDVPSQYGFLSELMPAALPFHSVWQSFYLLVSLSQFIAALLFYYLLRQQRPGLFNLLFAFLLVLAAVFLTPGASSGLFGPQTWPSYTAYRYGLVYAMLAVAYATSRRKCGIRQISYGLCIGCLLWCVGCFWSAEIGVWNTCIWLPMFIHLLYRKWKLEEAEGLSLNRRTGRIAFWAILQILLFVVALLIIGLVYRFKLGHGPDWSCYFDYIRSANTSSFLPPVPWPYAVTGYFWIPIIVLIGLVIVGSKTVKQGIHSGSLTLLAAAFTLVWTTNSYNIALLQPRTMEVSGELISLIGALVVLVVIRDLRFSGVWPAVLKACLVPIIGIELILAFWSPAALWEWGRTTMVRPPSSIDRLLPSASPSLVALMTTAAIKKTDSVVYLDHLAMPVINTAGQEPHEGWGSTWLPLTSGALIGPLAKDRLAVYMERFVTRTKHAGWLIEPLHRSMDNDALQTKALEQMPASCVPVKEFENRDYRITLYTYRAVSNGHN